MPTSLKDSWARMTNWCMNGLAQRMIQISSWWGFRRSWTSNQRNKLQVSSVKGALQTAEHSCSFLGSFVRIPIRDSEKDGYSPRSRRNADPQVPTLARPPDSRDWRQLWPRYLLSGNDGPVGWPLQLCLCEEQRDASGVEG